MAFDPDYGKTGFALHAFRIRRASRGLKGFHCLSQAEFAERFGLSLGAVKDAEQGRSVPSLAMRTLLEAIALDPALVARAAEQARAWSPEVDATGKP